MRPLRSAAALLALALPLAGCFQIASTLTVRPDGSAVLRDRVDLSGMAVLALMDEEEGKSGVDKARLRARAAALGPGVTLMALEEREAGFTAVYAVPDVGQLQYTVPDLPLGEDDGDETVADESLDLSFAFDAGSPSVLQIIVPEDGASDEAAPDGAPADGGDEPMTAAERAEAAQGIRLARALLGDARITVEVAVEGDVVESDAAYRDGSTVTVYDLEFDALFDVAEENPELMEGGEPTPDRLRALLTGREGVQLEEAGTVTVRFE
jgi:hypothetical protein